MAFVFGVLKLSYLEKRPLPRFVQFAMVEVLL